MKGDNFTNLIRIDFNNQETNKFLTGNKTLQIRTTNKLNPFYPQYSLEFNVYKDLVSFLKRLNFVLTNWLSLLQKQGG